MEDTEEENREEEEDIEEVYEDELYRTSGDKRKREEEEELFSKIAKIEHELEKLDLGISDLAVSGYAVLLKRILLELDAKYIARFCKTSKLICRVLRQQGLWLLLFMADIYPKIWNTNQAPYRRNKKNELTINLPIEINWFSGSTVIDIDGLVTIYKALLQEAGSNFIPLPFYAPGTQDRGDMWEDVFRMYQRFLAWNRLIVGDVTYKQTANEELYHRGLSAVFCLKISNAKYTDFEEEPTFDLETALTEGTYTNVVQCARTKNFIEQTLVKEHNIVKYCPEYVFSKQADNILLQNTIDTTNAKSNFIFTPTYNFVREIERDKILENPSLERTIYPKLIDENNRVFWEGKPTTYTIAWLLRHPFGYTFKRVNGAVKVRTLNLLDNNPGYHLFIGCGWNINLENEEDKKEVPRGRKTLTKSEFKRVYGNILSHEKQNITKYRLVVTGIAVNINSIGTRDVADIPTRMELFHLKDYKKIAYTRDDLTLIKHEHHGMKLFEIEYEGDKPCKHLYTHKELMEKTLQTFKTCAVCTRYASQ